MGLQGGQNHSWLHTRPHCTNTAFDGGSNSGSGYVPQAANEGPLLLHLLGYTDSPCSPICFSAERQQARNDTKGLNSRGGPGSWGGAERRSLGANSDLELWGQPLDHVDLAGFSFPLTCVKAERILERKGMMPQTTHRNQKMMRTPEDRTPCSRSYWISRVASSCAVRAAGAGPEHTSGPDSVPPHAPWLDVSGITPF